MEGSIRYLCGLWPLLGLLLAAPALAAPIDPASATTLWTVISYPTLTPDYSDDQQTGIPEADVVGTTADPAFYTAFDDGGTPSTTDGNIAFRVRVGADKNPAGFEHFLGVGIDADLDGALDLFLGVDFSGNPDQLGIFDPGAGANTSPSTTTIITTPVYSYSPTGTNFDFSAVDGVIDPTATTFDVDGDLNNDYFVSFVIPFADVVAALAANGIGGVTEDTVFQYVMGTSTQPNALNQDLGGPNGETTSALTWDALGAVSDPYSASGAAAAPEPTTSALMLIALIGLAARRSCSR